MTTELHAVADSLLSRGNVAGAIEALEQITARDAADYEAWLKLAALQRRAGQRLSALEAVNRALDARPNEFLALLFKGSLHQQLAESDRAAEVYRAAIFHAADTPNLPRPVQSQLERAREFLANRRSDIEANMPLLNALDQRHQARAKRFLDNVLDRRAIYTQKPTHYHYPDLPDIEFFDHDYSEFLQQLREAYPAIRSEFMQLAADLPDLKQPYVDFASGQPMGEWAALNKSPSWNAFHLVRYGEVNRQIAEICPETMKAFSMGPQADIEGLTPNLMFSLLAPRTKIPPHFGVANFRVLVHLPIIVPGQCFFRVGADTRPWVEGEPWIFDDTIEHEAWNDSDHLRVILIGDLWRPGLEDTDKNIVRAFFDAKSHDSSIDPL